VLDARNVAATFGASKLSNGELIPRARAFRSPALALHRGRSRPRGEPGARSLSCREVTALGAELDRIQSISGRASGTIKLREERGSLRESYDFTKVNVTLRHPAAPLPIAMTADASRSTREARSCSRAFPAPSARRAFQTLDAEVGFASGPVVQSASGAATVNLEELTPWIVASPPPRGLRGEVSALQGTIDVNLSRAAGRLQHRSGSS
jgi:hypothetical protein